MEKQFLNHKGVRSMNENVIPMNKPKSDRYKVLLGEIDETEQVIEKEQVGLCFLKPNSRAFRLKLWMFSNSTYFLIPDQADQTKYSVFSVEEYLQNEQQKSFWNKVGEAELFGNYLKIKLHLFREELFMSLFPINVDFLNESRVA